MFTLHEADPAADGTRLRCVISNECGSMASEVATMLVVNCSPDFTCDGFLNSQDLFDLLSAFF